MKGFLEETPVSWRIDADRSEYHFESEGIGSLRILAEPQEVPSGIGSIRLLVMVAEGTTSLLELRIEDEGGHSVLGLSSDAGGQVMLDIDRAKDGTLYVTGVMEADLTAYPKSGRTDGERQTLVLDVDGGRITATGH
ncbi:hypothetical protein STA1M1_07240 [Sinisalibacter aestuarii]|uniref:Uncharacterized protein n=2 Tax=Sinisalibacter aestuarii TaxID=2949426 RepID=A0ABQ5LPB7_9RHOB|nr:hypothetical protein STA1M1_07240 [Sinisalibacter aestuarii]